MSSPEHVYGSAIPALSDERVAELAVKMPPVTEPDAREIVRFYGPCNMDDGFTWGGKTERTAQVVAFVGRPFRTLHTFNAPSFFKPTLREVFAQIPDDVDIGPANAFCISYDDFEKITPEGGDRLSGRTYHAGKVQLLRIS